MENKRYPELCGLRDCTGCAACANVCPKDAITMTRMEDGFLQPVVDKEKCVQCLACERSCPVLTVLPNGNSKKPMAYACWNKEEETRRESSSGGAFSALATAILQEGGYVVGAAYDERMQVHQRMIHSLKELPLLRGSKYVQSNVGYIYRQVKQKLQEGAKVLFVGTPCQVAGLRSYLKREYPHLYCCDFICHGTPSPLLFQKYIQWIEQEKRIKVHAFNFRHKHSGWYDALRAVNGDMYMKGKYDTYFYGFNLNVTLRESCYHCPAIGLPRKGDITIADYWGIGMVYRFDFSKEIPKGISLLMVNNAKGDELLKKAQACLHWQERAFDETLRRNLPMVTPPYRPSERDVFYKDMTVMDFEQLRKKYFRVPMKARLIAGLREYAPRGWMVGLRSLLQYITWKRNGSKTLQKPLES